jgi:thioester reductase-like protein
MSTHVVTGGTGFVGAALILELLEQTDADILCLVRPEKGDIDARLYRVLKKAASAYGYDRHILAQAQRRCYALTGDVRAYLCGYSPTDLQNGVEQFWHCAASLKYEEENEQEIIETNVRGTQHALHLAQRLQARSFQYVSTAYVAGKRSGLIREELLKGHEVNNLYEASKLQAEYLVAQSTGVQTRIFRPSAIVGHSQTYAVSGTFTGFYGLAQNVLRLGILSRIQGEDHVAETLRVCLDPACPMNVIPVDVVAQQMVRIAGSSSTASIFHITNATPPTLATILYPILRLVDVKEPMFVREKTDFTALDHLMDQAMDYFNGYVVGRKVFDRSQSNQALGDDRAGDMFVDEPLIERYVRWYLPVLFASQPSLSHA